MEELDIIDTTGITAVGDTTGMLLKFLFNALFVFIIIRFLYYPKSRKKEYFFTFALISTSIFFLVYLLGGVKIKVGFALGLFAIFGIIRYRTESMSVREMTYLFVIIAVSVINALAVTLSYLELTVTNVIFLAIIFFCEKLPYSGSVEEKLVVYDRIELITPQRYPELVEDLKKRLGIDITHVQVGSVDFLHDTAMLKVFYRDSGPSTNEANKLLKLPKQ